MVVCIHTCRIRETWYLCVDISAGKFAFRSGTRTWGGPSRTPPCRLRTQSGRTGNWAGVVRLHVGRNEVEEGSRKGSPDEALRQRPLLILTPHTSYSPVNYMILPNPPERSSSCRGHSLRLPISPTVKRWLGGYTLNLIKVYFTRRNKQRFGMRPWGLSALHRVIVCGG